MGCNQLNSGKFRDCATDCILSAICNRLFRNFKIVGVTPINWLESILQFNVIYSIFHTIFRKVFFHVTSRNYWKSFMHFWRISSDKYPSLVSKKGSCCHQAYCFKIIHSFSGILSVIYHIFSKIISKCEFVNLANAPSVHATECSQKATNKQANIQWSKHKYAQTDTYTHDMHIIILYF